MSEISSGSRSSRRNKAEQKKFAGVSKKTAAITAGALVALLGAGVSVSALTAKSDAVPLAKTPSESSSKLFFQDTAPPEGWKANASAILEGRGDLVTVQNPAQIFSTDGKCSYSRQVFHLPSYQAGRTDEFLTRQYLYEVAQSNGATASDAQVVEVDSDKGKVEFLSASYALKPPVSSNDKNAKKETTPAYASNAVRAIDKAVQIEGVKESKGLFGSDGSKGIPVFFLSYECKSQSDWNADTWKSLLDSTKISLFNESVPAQPKPEPQPSTQTTGPASLTNPTPPATPAAKASTATAESEKPDTAESIEEAP